jgi:sugar diacid utilization regulator
MTDAYLAEARLLVAQRARARVALVEDLMHGRQPGDLEARELCERCGIRSGGHIAVAIARPLSGAPGDGTDRDAVLVRMSELVETSLSARGLGALVDRRDGAVVAIAASQADTARSMTNVLRGWVAEQRKAVDAPFGIGISLDVSDIAAVPQAYHEAERAVEFAEARRPVVHVADVDLVELVLRRPDAAALRLMPKWVDRFREADGVKVGELSSTIRAFADCNLNVKQTARRLELHTNTVYFRLNRIRELTGVDPRTFSGASLLLTTLRLLDAKTKANASQPWK